jgi:signal transduction histidine kinase
MRRRILTIPLLLMSGLLPAIAGVENAGAGLDTRTLSELEQQLTDIDSELEQLASYTLRGGTGALGYRSEIHPHPDCKEWIRIDLGTEVLVDQVVLAPTLYRDSETGLRSEGFPVEFRILAGTATTTNVVASFTETDHLLPRIAPLAVSFQPVTASWIGVDVSTLSAQIGDILYLLQLSEIMVFSGMENVALQKPVTVPHPSPAHIASRHERFLTDGFSPYLMDAAQGSRSQTQLIQVNTLLPPPSLTIDLKNPQPINQINLHTANVALSIPMARFDSWAVPRHVRVTGANRPDFTDQTVLCEIQQESIYDTGPVIMRRCPESVCRYIRIEILDPHPVASLDENAPDIAFKEIEVLFEGENRARGAPVTISSGLSAPADVLARLTDGLNYYGEILPVREWMDQLSRRHDLETDRPLVAAELQARYMHQKDTLRRMSWLAVWLVAGMIIILLIDQVIRQRAVFRTRERIAANLHDELGANLHAIGLFGDLAKQEIAAEEAEGQWGKLIKYINEVRSLTTQAGRTARYCTNMLEAKELYENLAEEMTRTADRLLSDIEHSLSFENAGRLNLLRPRRRIDLFLFYKECLTNILRHSGATRVRICLSADPAGICLKVRDNGHGLNGNTPGSLKRRARLLNARLTVDSPGSGGTEITLRLRPHRSFASVKRPKVQHQRSLHSTFDRKTFDKRSSP